MSCVSPIAVSMLLYNACIIFISCSTFAMQASRDKWFRSPCAQGAAYYLGMLAYYWVLVTPSVAFIFGGYLYLSVNLFHVHYDEAFSSLQIPHHKGFSRIHVTPEGDLHVYGLAIDQVRGLTCIPLIFSNQMASGWGYHVQHA